MKLRDKIALNSSFQALKQIVNAIAGIVSVAVATRYLSVDEYGAVVAALVLLSLLSFATDFGIGAMTVRAMARDPENEVAISSSAFWVWLAFSIPTIILLLGISQIAYPGPEGEITRQSVLILLAIFPLAPWAGVAAVRAIADQRVWLTSLGSLVARVFAVGGIVLAAALDTGPTGIAVAFAAGYIFEQIAAIVLIRPRVALRLGLHRARIWSLVLAAIPLGTVMVVNGLYIRLDAFLLSLLGTQSELAVYGVAYKAFESLLILPQFVMITLMPVLARLEFNNSRFQELVQKAFTSMCLLALPIAGFSLLGREAMSALAGPKYATGGLVLALIMCSVALSCVQGVFGNALVTQGRAGVLLRVSVSVLVANGLLNLAVIPLFGDIGAASALLFSETLSLVFTMIVYRRLSPLPRFERPARTLTALAALVAASLPCLTISSPTAAVGVAIVAGLLAYVLALTVLKALPSYFSGPVLSLVRSIRPGGAA